jgi:hypothetical protein
MMRRAFLLFAILLGSALTSFAQDDLFGTAKKEPRKGVVICLNASFDMPAGDMAKRFGLSYRVGPSFFYKTKSNWLFGAKADFIFGNKIKEEFFLSNLKAENEGFISYNGQRIGISTFERGYLIGLQAGRIINMSKKSSDNGIMLMTSGGFIQHKILINYDRNSSLPQLSGDYKKGYDRLSNGIFLEQFVGYTYFADNGLINFNIGLDVVAGFTKGRRDYLYDINRPGTDSRLDILYGIRGSWYIPVFRRKSEEFFFE